MFHDLETDHDSPSGGSGGADDIRRELAFFRGNRRRLHYADPAAAGYAIGSGSVEAANKVLVTAPG